MWRLSQPCCSQSDKLIVASDHEQVRFFKNTSQEVVPLAQFRRELRRRVDRRVDVAPQTRLGCRQRADDLLERRRADDKEIDIT
jgi:hypothetical protein